MASIGHYSKFIVAVIGLATVILTSYYPDAVWMPAAVNALAAAGVLLVPNQPAPGVEAPAVAAKPR